MTPDPSAPGPAALPRRLLETGRGSRSGSFGAAEWLLLACVALIWGSSFLFIDIGLEAFPVAQQWIDSSVAGMLNGAVPLAGAAWAVVLLRRPLPRIQAIGLLVGFAGVLAISWPQVQGSRATMLGVSLVLLAVLCYGLAVNLAVPLQQRYGALPVLLRAQLAALVLLLPFGLWGLGGSSFAWGPVLAMLPLGILGTGLAFVLMTTLVGRVGGPRGAVATYFIPVVAIVLGVVLLDERVAPAAVAGTALVGVGAWLTSRRER